jgi:hypothetical protein
MTIDYFVYYSMCDRGSGRGGRGSRAGPADAAELDSAMDTYFAAR